MMVYINNQEGTVYLSLLVGKAGSNMDSASLCRVYNQVHLKQNEYYGISSSHVKGSCKLVQTYGGSVVHASQEIASHLGIFSCSALCSIHVIVWSGPFALILQGTQPYVDVLQTLIDLNSSMLVQLE